VHELRVVRVATTRMLRVISRAPMLLVSPTSMCTFLSSLSLSRIAARILTDDLVDDDAIGPHQTTAVRMHLRHSSLQYPDSLTHSDSGSFRRMRTALASNPNERTNERGGSDCGAVVADLPRHVAEPDLFDATNRAEPPQPGRPWQEHDLVPPYCSCLVIDAPLSSLTQRRQTTGWTLRARSTGAPAARATYEPKLASWVAR